MINIGYACQIDGYRDYTIKTCRLGNASSERLDEIITDNLSTLERMLQYNNANNIRLFRISSDIIPLASHPEIKYNWQDKHAAQLVRLGALVQEYDMRVSMHPGQYTVLNSPDGDVVKRAVLDLEYHAHFLHSLHLPTSHKMILHIGGTYGDKQAAMERFVERAKTLSKEVLSRLIVENDDRQFNADDVLWVCNQLNIPAIFDTLHHQCNPGSGDIQAYLQEYGQTWKQSDGNQKIHYSQQAPGEKSGKHSKSINLDQWLKDSCYFDNLDVMLEVKDKNISAIKCNLVSNGASRQEIESIWGAYKYLVMRHSQPHYNKLRVMFRTEVACADFFSIVDEALNIEPTPKSVINSAEHVWGYFKKDESANKFQALLQQYQQGKRSVDAVFNFLYKLAVKYDSQYLLDSLSFRTQ